MGLSWQGGGGPGECPGGGPRSQASLLVVPTLIPFLLLQSPIGCPSWVEIPMDVLSELAKAGKGCRADGSDCLPTIVCNPDCATPSAPGGGVPAGETGWQTPFACPVIQLCIGSQTAPWPPEMLRIVLLHEAVHVSQLCKCKPFELGTLEACLQSICMEIRAYERFPMPSRRPLCEVVCASAQTACGSHGFDCRSACEAALAGNWCNELGCLRPGWRLLR